LIGYLFQVVFVTSGICKEGDELSRAAFAEIASISSGHIFQLNETDVEMVSTGMNFQKNKII